MELSSKQNEYIVYCHTNKINGKKYIGITKQTPEHRWQKGKGYIGMYFGNAILKYGWDNFEHEILFTGLARDEACEKERELIKWFKSNKREFGYNLSEGGNVFDGMTGKKGLEHPNHKRVKMIDPNTLEVVKIFDSQIDAAKYLGVDRRLVTKGCLGYCVISAGYIWEYADIDYKKPDHPGVGNYDHSNHNKSIVMTDSAGNEYHFKSVKQASEITGICRCSISKYLKGRRKDPAGRRWCYEL